MTRHIALLRGINVSGKNRIPMAALRQGFEQLGFTEIKTYLNSGNVIFSSTETDIETLTVHIETMIHRQFGFDIPVFVITTKTLMEILRHAPDWWGTENKEIYDNLIFILPPVTFTEVRNEIGAPKEGLEQIQNYKNAIFWSFNRKDYQKTNWWPRTANTAVSRSLTIRTANTIRKIVGM